MELTCSYCGKIFQSNRRSRKYCSCACSNFATAKKRANEHDNKDAVIVWSSGGGIQSTAIAVLICQGVLPKPDYALMVDCGYESTRTLDYIRRVVSPKLDEVGVKFHVISSQKYVSVDLVDAKGHCNIPAFRKLEDGSVSHLSTRCNGTWKQTVMKKWLREQGVEKCLDWVGISTDEARRANKDSGAKWIVNSYPLMELNYSRTDCVNIIKKAGWEMPLRTSCIMCPQRTKFEWLRLFVDCPEDFERACKIEKEIQETDSTIWLSSECRTLAEVILGEYPPHPSGKVSSVPVPGRAELSKCAVNLSKGGNGKND